MSENTMKRLMSDRVAVALICLMGASAPLARAASRNLGVDDGYWDDATHWGAGGQVPTLDDTANVSGQAVHRNVNITNNVAAQAASLKLGTASNASGSCKMSGGTLEISSELQVAASVASQATFDLSGGVATINTGRIGYYGNGLFRQSGGALASSSWTVGAAGQACGTNEHTGGTAVLTTIDALKLGGAEGSSGVYLLSGDAVLDIPQIASETPRVTVGSRGTGYLRVDGGVMTGGNKSELQIGHMAGSWGRVRVDSGECTMHLANVGRSSTGFLEQHGGKITIHSSMTIGSDQSKQGYCLLTGGELHVGANCLVGNYGEGFLTQSGGQFYCGGNLSLANRTNSYGVYTHSFGRAEVAGDMNLGVETNTMARYTISGGSISAGSMTLGNGVSLRDAVFTVVGVNTGVTVANTLTVNAHCTYEATLTPEGFSAPQCETLYLSSNAKLRINALEKLPHSFDNQEFTIMRRNLVGSNNVGDFRNVTVETGEEYGDIRSATVLYYEDRIAIQIRVHRPPYGTVMLVR